jgi:inosose dehydratase
MQPVLTRQDFLLTTCAAVSAASTLRAAAQITLGYAAITWGGNDVQAIEEVSSLGFKGIQLRSSAVDRFAAKPEELKALLQKHHLTMAVLSSGNLRLDPSFETDDLAKHAKNAQFVRAIGGVYLQVLDEPPKGKPLDAEDYKRMGRLLSELGKRTADAAIPLVYHNHMNSMSQPPEGMAKIMEATDPRYVRLLLDVAHYQQGGGDPVKAVTEYKDRIQVVHLKDVSALRRRPRAHRHGLSSSWSLAGAPSTSRACCRHSIKSTIAGGASSSWTASRTSRARPRIARRSTATTPGVSST